ncbi:MAG TPA: signal peptidase II [Polyangia bacterium]|nr:signal peptidase II [Polyangia bacterium]
MTAARRKYLLFAVFTALSLILDQWTKLLAREELRPRGPFNPKVIVEGYFDLRYAENPGVAFSMLQDIPGGRVLLTLLAVAALVLVILYLRQTPEAHTRLHVALGLVGGGAIGNLVDRVLYGRVTDFIVWKVGRHEWPAFNVADAALCVGVGLMVLDMFLNRGEAPPAPA